MDSQSILMHNLLTSLLHEHYYQTSLQAHQSLDQSSMHFQPTSESMFPNVGTRRMLGRVQTGLEPALRKESHTAFESNKSSVGRSWVNKRTQSRRSHQRNKREIHREAKRQQEEERVQQPREKRVLEREKPSRELRVVGQFSRKSRYDRPLAAFVMSLDTSRGNQYIPILPRHLRKP